VWESVNRTGVWEGEIWNHRKNGEEYSEWLTIAAVADNQGLVTNYVATLTDTTEFKRREQQRLVDESAHRDALVREVHHRIKNNLQGVTGVLRNFAAQHLELTDPITNAISQVQSIAVFYGLQGREAQAKVRLCELTSAIAANNASLWQTSIAVDIPQHWIPCRITETEAVPLALVLNELISNAVKHGDHAKGVNIALRHEPLPHMVQVTITNPGRLPPDFDFPRLPTTGTGLQLIASLLPRKYANLSWEQLGDTVAAQLELAPPIITLEQEEMEILR
jgi:two-component sensor histidine kinase